MEKMAPQFKCLVLKFVFPPLCAGNLYSREVQVDGEQVTIQVQDTPGAEVGHYSPQTGTSCFVSEMAELKKKIMKNNQTFNAKIIKPHWL